MTTKKYIAPGGWFSLEYPDTWNEFEDEEGSFLFYNPAKWSGNFRISVFKDASTAYARQTLVDELKQNPQARQVKVGQWESVYSTDPFTENGEQYVTHLWLTGKGNTVAECSFTAQEDVATDTALQIIATLELRDEKKRYPREYIPVRVLEINEIDEAFEWATSQVRKRLKKDFNSTAQDIARLQQIIDGKYYTARQTKEWNAIGITFGTILVNEIDGMDWITVIDGRREYPALRFKDTGVVVEAAALITSKQAKGEPCDLQKEFEHIKNQVEAVL